MDSLPEAIVQHILSFTHSAKDVACCSSVSKQWQQSIPYLRTLFFPRNAFDNVADPNLIISNMISSLLRLQHLVVYCPFSSSALSSWLTHASHSLTHLELRMDNISITPPQQQPSDESDSDSDSSKLDSISILSHTLQSLKLWGVSMTHSPKWHLFPKLTILEIVGARLQDPALSLALQACPNLTHLLLRGCDGVGSLSIHLPLLQQCRLDFYGAGNCSLSMVTPQLEYLEVVGCSRIIAHQTKCLRYLSIANVTGRVYMLDFGKLASLEFLDIRGVQWSWDAIKKLVESAGEVKQLYMKVEFTGDFEPLLPFPEIDLVHFFTTHPRLQKIDIHGALFAALCQKNSLKSVDSGFVIPCLEEMVITVRSPLNAEQKMSTLETLVRRAKKMKTMVIRVLQMRSSHSSADDFFDEICRFQYLNRNIVRIQ